MASRFSPGLAAVARRPYPTTVLGVLNRMEELQETLGGWESTNPLGAFNFLYHAITSSVAHRLGDLDAPALEASGTGQRSRNPLFHYFEHAIDEVANMQLSLGPVGLEDPNGAEPRTTEIDVHPRLADLAGRIDRGFGDPEFMRTLDVNFAELYLRALRGWADDEQIPQAWAVLFSHWDDDRGEGPFSGALLGVHAHINHDLAIAVLRSHETHHRRIDPESVLYDDYLLINDIFEVQTPLLHHQLVNRLEGFKYVVWSTLGAVGLETVARRILVATREWAWMEATNMQNGTTARPVGEPALINPTTDEVVGELAEHLLAMYL